MVFLSRLKPAAVEQGFNLDETIPDDVPVTTSSSLTFMAD